MAVHASQADPAPMSHVDVQASGRRGDVSQRTSCAERHGGIDLSTALSMSSYDTLLLHIMPWCAARYRYSWSCFLTWCCSLALRDSPSRATEMRPQVYNAGAFSWRRISAVCLWLGRPWRYLRSVWLGREGMCCTTPPRRDGSRCQYRTEQASERHGVVH